MAFFFFLCVERADKKSFISPPVSAEVGAAPTGAGRVSAGVVSKDGALDFESAVNGGANNTCRSSAWWRHEQQPYSEGMKALFWRWPAGSLQGKRQFRSFIPPTRSRRANPSRRPISTRYRWNRRGLFLFLFFPPLGSISFLSESLFKEKTKKTIPSRAYCRLIGRGGVEYWRALTPPPPFCVNATFLNGKNKKTKVRPNEIKTGSGSKLLPQLRPPPSC